MQQPPSLSWWQRLAFLLTFQHPVHKYNPLTQAGPLSFDDEVELTSESKPRGLQTEETGEATNGSENEGAEGFPDEVMINTDLLQMGDVAPDVLHVDERLVSGEGRGVAKLAGQRVIGGSRNASHADAYIKVEVIGDASVLQTLLRLVNTGQQQQPPLQKAAETFAAYFIPVVLCITTVAVISWTVKVFGAADTLPLSPLQQMKQRLIELEQSEGIASRQRSLMLQRLHLEQQRQQHIESYGNFLRASGSLPPPSVSIVDATSVDDHAAAAAAAAACRLSGWVVTWDSLLFALRFGVAVCCAACPCAIGLAAPAAVAAATAAAAARGVFFKTGKSLETAAKTSLLVVDKTGTLTTGELRVRLVKPPVNTTCE
ncbi:hypothetical protein ETH_00009640 [Eimeria tenella]|uniref:Uncharacterized protein n=1 Tax=Eimeria tenella TaxID=5802 RepID=U6KJN7_EIMTE|nr:hypothetical protein ETH_00009640 [Eimeria tenella]CDJ38245.1 hypothetical protein ETH_00009640 [Eimeria tenella]|eukprot:XP_013229083.1 hypothetical protein ETH_00009640 [Eimeria tenella]